jgi:ribosomal protein S18 acetylase RimI-like enzyme
MKARAEVIRPACTHDFERIAEIATQAWTPIFAGWADMQRAALGQVVEEHLPEKTGDNVRAFCEAHPDNVWVTESAGQVVGFITFDICEERGCGEIGYNAVDPAHTRRGIGTMQCEKVLQLFRQAGLRYATVTTNHDDGHASARRMYEKVGFVPVFISLRYMRLL